MTRTERRLDTVGDVVAVVTTIGLFAMVVTGAGGPVRLVFAVVFVSYVPGWAVLDHVRLASGSSKVALAAGISLAVCVVFATALLWARAWHPFALLFAVGSSSVVAIGGSLVRRSQSADTEASDP